MQCWGETVTFWGWRSGFSTKWWSQTTVKAVIRLIIVLLWAGGRCSLIKSSSHYTTFSLIFPSPSPNTQTNWRQLRPIRAQDGEGGKSRDGYKHKQRRLVCVATWNRLIPFPSSRTKRWGRGIICFSLVSSRKTPRVFVTKRGLKSRRVGTVYSVTLVTGRS